MVNTNSDTTEVEIQASLLSVDVDSLIKILEEDTNKCRDILFSALRDLISSNFICTKYKWRHIVNSIKITIDKYGENKTMVDRIQAQ